MHKFNRIFDRKNVALRITIDIVDHRAQRDGLIRACRTGYSTRPRNFSDNVRSICGALMASNDWASVRMVRNAAAGPHS